jgi:hypothetical protein
MKVLEAFPDNEALQEVGRRLLAKFSTGDEVSAATVVPQTAPHQTRRWRACWRRSSRRRTNCRASASSVSVSPRRWAAQC